MVKITSPAPDKEHKHIVRKESLIEIPLGREGRVYSSTTSRARVHHSTNNNNYNSTSVPRCFLWTIMALSACSLTFMGVRNVNTLRHRVNDMARRIDVLRAEKAYLETLVGDKMTKNQFLAKTYTSNDILSFVDQEPEPFSDRWSFNINVVWTSDYITYCNMYWLSRNIANRIYDKVIQVPRVIMVVNEENELMEEVNEEIALENEMIEETKEENKLIEELTEEDKMVEEFTEEKEVLDMEDVGGSGVEPMDESFDSIISESVEDSFSAISDNAEDMIAGANGEDLNHY